MKKVTLVIFFYSFFNADLHCHAEPILKINPITICFNSEKSCVDLNVITDKTNQIKVIQSSANRYILRSFVQVNPQKVNNLILENKLTKNEVRKLLKKTSTAINENFKQQLNYLFKKFYRHKIIKNISFIPIDNSIEIYVDPKYKEWFEKFSTSAFNLNIDKLSNFNNEGNAENIIITKGNLKESPSITIGLIDSGVTNKHESMKHLSNLKQYNPEDDSFELHDSALGHGTGVLSLVAGKHLHTTSNNANTKYYSCNGLPQGKYQYHLVLKCLNWLYLNTDVDILINPWLMENPGCDTSLQHAYDLLWLSGVIPIFPSGNYGPNKSYSPANYRLFDGTPIISVGSIKSDGTIAKESSFGVSACDEAIITPTFVEEANNVKVAVPFTQESYQITKGTSYAIGIFAHKLLTLLKEHPDITRQELYQLITSSADNQKPKKAYGLGVLNIEKAKKQLKNKSNTLVN